MSRDGAPLGIEDLLPLESGIAHCGADGCNSWLEGPAGLAHAHFWTTPEEIGETQPLFRAGGRLALAADLRLDNRADLCAAIGGLDERKVTDAEILLAAYERWGEDCPRHLVGDFAFALWDGRRRRLFCARDPIGMRPFYYSLTPRRFVAASNLEAILASLTVPVEIHEPFLRDLQAWRFDRWSEETPYRGLLRLPPAHRLTVEGERVSLVRYWTFGAEPDPALRRDEDYAERFRELFLGAVGSRLRSAGPVGFLVSGGLDSSAIACAAHHLLETGALPETGLRFFSSVFSATPGAEEREYAEAVAHQCPRARITYLPSDDCWGLREFGGDEGYPRTEPEVSVNRALFLRPLRQARQDGCRVVLAGIGGDQVLGGEPYHKPIQLRDVGVSRLLAELPHFRRSSRKTLAGVLADAYLRPAVPEGVRRLVRRARKRGASPVAAVPGQALATRAARESLRYLTDGTFSARMAGLRIAADHAGVEVRLPFLDRRLIDFVLALPSRLRFRDGWIKWILRQSMVGILPEAVRQRQSLAWFSALEHRGLRREARQRIHRLLADSCLVRRGLASEAALREAWSEYWAGPERLAPPRPLIGFLCAESWLRAYEETRPAFGSPSNVEHA